METQIGLWQFAGNRGQSRKERTKMLAGSEKKSSCSWVGGRLPFERGVLTDIQKGNKAKVGNLHAYRQIWSGVLRDLLPGRLEARSSFHLHCAISGYILMQNPIALCAA